MCNVTCLKSLVRYRTVQLQHVVEAGEQCLQEAVPQELRCHSQLQRAGLLFRIPKQHTEAAQSRQNTSQQGMPCAALRLLPLETALHLTDNPADFYRVY